MKMDSGSWKNLKTLTTQGANLLGCEQGQCLIVASVGTSQISAISLIRTREGICFLRFFFRKEKYIEYICSQKERILWKGKRIKDANARRIHRLRRLG
jgi:hypothetical protein